MDEENQDVEKENEKSVCSTSKKKGISVCSTLKEDGISGVFKEIGEIGEKAIIYLCFGTKGWERYHYLKRVSPVDIFERWKSKWFSDKLEQEKNVHKKFFGELFEANYRYAKLKKKKNKTWNFRWKRIFVITLLVGFIIGCVLGYEQYINNQDNLWQEAIYGSVLLFLLTLLCGIVSKWLDVKRYQETWVRHSVQLQLMEKEMLLYIEELEPYDKYSRDEIFILRIIDIWDKNQEKFAKNMEKNEKEMMNIFEYMKRYIGCL